MSGGRVRARQAYRRRRFLALASGLLCAAVLPRARAAEPLLFHDHGHGLAFSPDGRALLAPSHVGVAVYEDGAWWEAPGPKQGFSGFSATASAIYASGHEARGPGAGRPVGLLRSRDGGRTWRALSLAGEADFHILAAGYRSGEIYALTGASNSVMAPRALYATRDEGATWRPAAVRGLGGEIHGLAAHPAFGGTLAAATGRGLYISRDGGESFAAVDVTGPVTAVAFDLDGERLRYALALASQLLQREVAGRPRGPLRLPPLSGDFVTCLAQSPVDASVLAFATRRRDVYLSRDGGARWRAIAAAGAARAEGTDGDKR